MHDPPADPDPAVTGKRDLIGTTVGRYRVLSPLGGGGQGEVYLAEDPKLFRKVALKKLPPELARDRYARKKAVDEAVRASRLSDPRVAAVFDIVEEEDDVTLVLEYVEGRTLRDRMAEEIPLREFWDLAVQCVEAVEAAHRAGLLHRDIKPENIAVTPGGRVKILDFGIAKRLPRPDELTSMTTQTYLPDMVAGTPPYMSPEAHLNGTLDERSDLFSLGVVFYEMLTGRRPFRGNLAEIIDGILRSRPEPPSAVVSGIPQDLDHVILKLLSRDRERRYPSAGELLDDMIAARRGELVNQGPTERLAASPDEPEPEPSTRRLWLSILVVAVAGLLVVSVTVPGLRFEWKRRLGMSVLPERVSAALLPFQVEDHDADIEAFGGGLFTVVTDRLNRIGARHGVYVSPVSEVHRYEVSSPEKARTELGVTVALTAQIHLQGTELYGTLALVDAGRQRVLDRASVREAWTEPARFVDALNAKAAAMLDIDGTPGAPPASSETGTGIPASAYRFRLEGLGRLESAGDSATVAAAMADLQRAVSIAPEVAVSWADLARSRLAMYRETGNPSWRESAARAAQDAPSRDPSLPAARPVRAAVLSEEERWEEAIPQYRLVIEHDPGHREAYRGLAAAHEQLGFPDSAEAVYEEAIAALPRDYRCYWYLGYFYYRRGQDEKALEAFRRMTEAAPDLSRGYAYYGGILVQAGRYRPAVKALERSIELHPIDSAFTNLGTAYFQLRNFDEAIRTYREAIGLGYRDYRFWYNLGDAYFWSPGKKDLAADCYARAIDLGKRSLAEDPTDPYVAAELADMFPKIGHPDSSRAYIRRALDRNPDHPYIQYWAALVAWQLGERDEAMDWIERAVANGYSRTWLEDSPIFDEWRTLERFQAILRKEGA